MYNLYALDAARMQSGAFAVLRSNGVTLSL
jgi:hypothetical protein